MARTRGGQKAPSGGVCTQKGAGEEGESYWLNWLNWFTAQEGLETQNPKLGKGNFVWRNASARGKSSQGGLR